MLVGARGQGCAAWGGVAGTVRTIRAGRCITRCFCRFDRFDLDVLGFALFFGNVGLLVWLWYRNFSYFCGSRGGKGDIRNPIDSQFYSILVLFLELSRNVACKVEGTVELHGAAAIVLPRQDALTASFAIFELTGEGLNRRSHLSLALELAIDECAD